MTERLDELGQNMEEEKERVDLAIKATKDFCVEIIEMNKDTLQAEVHFPLSLLRFLHYES